jgi:hypothetical protein
MDLCQFCNVFVHEILSGDVEGTWEVVDLLVPLKSLEDSVFNARNCPDDSCLLLQHLFALDALKTCSIYSRRLAILMLYKELFGIRKLPESVVF